MDITFRKAIRDFWREAGPHQSMFIRSWILMLLVLVTEWAKPLVMMNAFHHMEAGEKGALRHDALIFLGLIFADYLFRSGFSYLFSMGVLHTINRIRYHVFQHVLRMKMAFFDKEPVGRLLTRTINDCETLGETLRAGVSTVIVDVLSIFIVLGVMIQMDFQLSLVMIFMVPVTWILIRWCGKRLREKFLSVRKALADANGFMAEGIMGVAILQLFQKQRDSVREFKHYNRIYRHATITSNVYDALLSALIDGISAIATALILLVAFNIKFGLMEIAILTVFMNQVERIFVPIRDFSGKFATIQQAFAALQRVFGLLHKKEHLPQGPKTLHGDRFRIMFNDVSFRYAQDGPKVLQNIDFAIDPGQVIALVGQTGSGKSTIGKLLTRAYDGYEGEISVGGVELKQLNYNALRSKIAVIHQDVELFPATIRDNISMFDDSITEEKIRWAIELIHAEHMIDQLPDGLYHQVQENGGNLSAGQMQLIVFARALAHDAPIVLMDEATSSVDSVTESWIQDAITQIFKHKTVLIVAHRLSTIASADTILALRDGVIVERGTHQELAALEKGYYADLIQASRLQLGHDDVLV